MSAEKISLTMNRDSETSITYRDPEGDESGPMQEATRISDLTPYGMILTSLGSCTAIVLHSYATNHAIDLMSVTLTLHNKRVYKDDCANCELGTEYKDTLTLDIELEGNLTEAQREKLHKISHQCPIHKMLKKGFDVTSSLSHLR